MVNAQKVIIAPFLNFVKKYIYFDINALDEIVHSVFQEWQTSR